MARHSWTAEEGRLIESEEHITIESLPSPSEGGHVEYAEEHRRMDIVASSAEGGQMEDVEEHRRMQTVALSGERGQAEVAQEISERMELTGRGVTEASTETQRMRIIVHQEEILQQDGVQTVRTVELEEVIQRLQGILSFQRMIQPMDIHHLEQLHRIRMVQLEEMVRSQEEFRTIVGMVQREEMVQNSEEIQRMRISQEEEIRRMGMAHRELLGELEGTLRVIMDQLEAVQRSRMPLQMIEDLQEAVNNASRRGAPPASRSAVNGLSDVSNDQRQANDGSSRCSICLENFLSRESLKQLPCSHFYHKTCILRWLESRNSCPLCRDELPTDDLEYEEQRRN